MIWEFNFCVNFRSTFVFRVTEVNVQGKRPLGIAIEGIWFDAFLNPVPQDDAQNLLNIFVKLIIMSKSLYKMSFLHAGIDL